MVRSERRVGNRFQISGYRHMVLWVGLILASTFVQAASDITKVRMWLAPDNTRLVFDTSGKVVHSAFTLDNPDRLVIDVKEAEWRSSVKNLDLTGSPILSIRTGIRNGRDLRIVLDLARPVTPTTFELEPGGQYGHRLVVDLNEETRVVATEPLVTKTLSDHDEKRDIIIYIDPGHGGEDPGAMGAGGIQEKQVVLSISRYLRDSLSAEPGFRGVLTRDGDYYIGLRKRTHIARKGKADMFVSVHADAFNKESAKGASVFALSGKGATSETARWLADAENRSDLIGGVGSVSLDDKNSVLAGVLLDLSMTASLKSSLSVGDEVLQAMGQFSHLHKRNVEQAGFVVLKSPDIPSILVETGFISNPVEARKLSSPEYQKQMARAIARGVMGHFSDQPPPGTLVAWRKEMARKNIATNYQIKRGDTLSGIAKDNGTTVGRLREYNGLNDSSIRIGQVIQIPAS